MDSVLSSLPDSLQRRILDMCLTSAAAETLIPTPPLTHQGTSIQPRGNEPDECWARQDHGSSRAGHGGPDGRTHEPHVPYEASCAACIALTGLTAGVAVLEDFLSTTDVKAVLEDCQAALSEKQWRAGMGGNHRKILGEMTGVAAGSSTSCGTLPGGSAPSRWSNSSARGDVMRWLHVGDEHQAGRMALHGLLQRLSSLRPLLQGMGYDVGGRITFQAACYPGGGARYVRHCDASSSAPDRVITAICYLNPGWDIQQHGGQLAIYNIPKHRLPTLPSRDIHLPASSSRSSPNASAAATWGPSGSDAEPGTKPDSPGPAAASCFAPSSSHASLTPPSSAAPSSLPDLGTIIAPLSGRLVIFDSALPHEVLPSYNERYAVTTWFYRSAQAGDAPVGKTAKQGGLGAASGAATTACTPSTPFSAVLSPEFTLAASLEDTAAVNSMQQVAAPAAFLRPASLPSTLQPGTIFVSIASYRDPETRWTVWDLFKKARWPESISVGIVWQVDPIDDADLTAHVGQLGGQPPAWLRQIREVRVPWQEAEGPCWARHLAQQLYRNETYVLQLDSHMRFVEGWDELCMQQLQLAEAVEQPIQSGSSTPPFPKVVLSTYPQGYDGDGAAAALPTERERVVPHLCASSFDTDGLLRLVARSLSTPPPMPLPCPFWAAGFSFSRAALLLEVPYPPVGHVPQLFFGEEAWMLARMCTRGWAVYSPSVPIIFHQWRRSGREHTFQRDVALDLRRRKVSQQKVLAVLGASTWPESTNDNGVGEEERQRSWTPAQPHGAVRTPQSAGGPEAQPVGEGGGGLLLPEGWRLGEVWGLGREASLATFEARVGVSFKNRELTQTGLWGGLTATSFVKVDA